MNSGRIVDVMTLIGMNNGSRSSDSEEAQWEAMLCACLLQCSKGFSTRY